MKISYVLLVLAFILFGIAIYIMATSDYSTHIEAWGPYGSDVHRWRPDNPIWFWLVLVASGGCCCCAISRWGD